MRRLLIFCAAASALAGCVEAPPPRLGPVATGPGEWRVIGHAPDAAAARLRGLREAASLTLAQGGDWFRVRDRDLSERDGEGRDIGAFEDLSTSQQDARSGLSLDIQIGHAPRPEGEDVYDARAVAEQLGGGRVGPRVRERPPEGDGSGGRRSPRPHDASAPRLGMTRG